MCGRFTLTADGELVQQVLGLAMPPQLTPRYNVSPSQPVAVVRNDAPDTLDYLSWGLVPFWAKDPAIGNRMINARSETAHEKPSFKAAMKYRRCLIPADGWYEWQEVPNSKHKAPMFIHKEDFAGFAFAGLWEQWNAPDGSEVLTCTILTTDATESLKPLHHRMPIVLQPDAYEPWLHGEDAAARHSLLTTAYDESFVYYPVSTRVNKPANDSPENIVPLEGGGAQQMSLF